MKKLTNLYKKNGVEMHINDNSLEYALSLGWTKTKPKKATKSKKEAE